MDAGLIDVLAGTPPTVVLAVVGALLLGLAIPRVICTAD